MLLGRRSRARRSTCFTSILILFLVCCALVSSLPATLPVKPPIERPLLGRTQPDHGGIHHKHALLRQKGGTAEQEEYVQATLLDIVKQFGPLGWTAFGGPAAHIGLFQTIFAEKLRWLPSSVFMELFALGQCLPGPSSTQVAISIGVLKQGILGGVVAGICFLFPGMAMLTALGMAVRTVGDSAQHPVFKGFCAGVSAAGVALVARASSRLTRATCPDTITQSLNGIAAFVAYSYPTSVTFPALILFGGIITFLFSSAPSDTEPDGKEGTDVNARDDHQQGISSFGLSKVAGASMIALRWALLGLSVMIARHPELFGTTGIHIWWASFYRVGALILGGGQVVLPMLMAECIRYVQTCSDVNGGGCHKTADYLAYDSSDLKHPKVQSWMREDEFLTGLGLAQGMPGPMFNLSAYLGAVLSSRTSVHPVIGAFATWLGLFTPAFLLIFGGLPWWGTLRTWSTYKRALPGMNSAAAGLVVAAVFNLYDRARGSSPFPEASVGIGIASFVAVEVMGIAAPIAILLAGFVGILRATLIIF